MMMKSTVNDDQIIMNQHRWGCIDQNYAIDSLNSLRCINNNYGTHVTRK